MPNEFLDSIMPSIDTMAELKVTLAIIRRTFGWHVKKQKLTINNLVELTGLSRQSVANGITAALEHGHISREEDKVSGFVYSLVVQDLDQGESKSLTNDVLKIRLPTIYKEIKESKKKESDVLSAVLKIWNEEKLDNWTRHQALTGRAIGQVKKLVDYFGEENVEAAVRAAMNHAKKNDFYQSRQFSFANIFGNDKGVEYAEAEMNNAPEVVVGGLYRLPHKPGWVARVKEPRGSGYLCMTAQYGKVDETRQEVVLTAFEIGERIHEKQQRAG